MINLRYRKQIWKEITLVSKKEISSAGAQVRFPTLIFEYSRTQSTQILFRDSLKQNKKSDMTEIEQNDNNLNTSIDAEVQ